MILAHTKPQSDTWMIWTILVAIAISTIAKVVSYVWPNIIRWSEEKRSRKWPSVSAVIDIAAVAKELVSTGGKGGGAVFTYRALLSYSYRNPDLQTGDYNRNFSDETDAKEWADSLKGRQVVVYVNPRDPALSVLRTEDVDAAFSQET